MHRLLHRARGDEKSVRYSLQLHHAQVILTRTDGQLARLLRINDAFLQYGGDIVLPVVMLHGVERRLCVDLLYQEAVVGRGRCHHERVDALKFGVKFQRALYRLTFVGMALVEYHTHEYVVFPYLGVVLTRGVVDRGA